jgi:hypothetical protein
MELLDRYLHAVKFWLPKAQQEDIIAELAEDLRSQIEDKEAETGRKLDEDDLVAILEQRGHPMLVASRYLPQQSLIGPAWFPVYWFVLKLVLLWILPPVFVLIVGPAAVLTSRSAVPALIETLWTFAMASVFAFGTITLVFVALERYPHKITEQWDPRRLPRVPATKAVVDPQRVPLTTAVAELLGGIGFSLLWADVTWLRTSFDLDSVRITLAPIWRSLFWPILLITLSGIPIGLVGLLRPWRTRWRSALRLAVDCISLIIAGALLNAAPWVTLSAPKLSSTALAEAAKWTNAGMSIALSAIFILTLVDAIQEALRLYRRTAGAHTPVVVRR